MTTNPPPNGMARVYICSKHTRDGERVPFVWDGYCWDGDGVVASAYAIDNPEYGAVEVPEWSAANWDEPPEFVMAPDLGGRKNVEYIFHEPTDDDGWDYFRRGFYTPAAVEEAARTRPLYRAHPPHPEVLRRVWVREEAPSHVKKCRHDNPDCGCPDYGICDKCEDDRNAPPVPPSSVDWAAVAKGTVVPPARLSDLGPCRHGDVHLVSEGGVLGAWEKGDFVQFCTRNGAEWPAAYSPTGHILCHRTADGGWREVPVNPEKGNPANQRSTAGLGVDAGSCDRRPGNSAQAGERPAPTNPGEVANVSGDKPHRSPQPERKENTDATGAAVTASDARGLAKPDLRAIMQDQARRRDLFDARVAYQTGAEPVAMTPEFFRALEKQRGKR